MVEENGEICLFLYLHRSPSDNHMGLPTSFYDAIRGHSIQMFVRTIME